MITIPININYRFKFPVIDQDTGKFVTGLTIAYSLVKTSDGTVIGSGNCSEVGTTGVYYFDYTYTVAQEYDVIITTPSGYYDGVETIMVENAVDVSASAVWDYLLTSILTAGSIGKLIKDNLDAPISGISSITTTDVETALKNYDSAKQATVKQDITNSQDIIITEINKVATPVVVPQEKQRPYNW